MSDVLVDRLRIHAPHRGGPAPDPQASARELDLGLPFPDRQVLIVRRLAVASGDRAAARTRLETMRRQAVHPSDGPVDPHAEAVVFADEAEALLCLTRDLVSGRAGQWYWAGRLPAHSAGTGDLLGRLWAEQPRWVPAVLSHLARNEPDVAALALRALPPGASELIAREVAQEYGVPAPVPGHFSAPPMGHTVQGSDAGARRESLTLPQGRVTSAAPRLGDPAPDAALPAQAPGRPGAGPSEVFFPPAARRLLELALGLVPGPCPSLLGVPSGAEANPVPTGAIQPAPTQPADQPAGLATNHRTTSTSSRAGIGSASATDAAGAAIAALGDDPAGTARPEAPDELNLATTRDRGKVLPAWSGSATTTRSAVASAAYAIALIQRTGTFPAAARGENGWATVEAVVRWLLAGLPRRRRQAALRDPLFRVLGELGGRRPGSPSPLPPNLATRRRMLALLSRHGVPRSAFARAGTVHVSRTHVDVVFPINAIDLAVRTAGLDQDPGWVPDLARVVLVHFEGGG